MVCVFGWGGVKGWAWGRTHACPCVVSACVRACAGARACVLGGGGLVGGLGKGAVCQKGEDLLGGLWMAAAYNLLMIEFRNPFHMQLHEMGYRW
jgi:hypothetical protein